MLIHRSGGSKAAYATQTPSLAKIFTSRKWRSPASLTLQIERSYWLATLLLWGLSGLAVFTSAYVGTVVIAGHRGWAEGAHCCGLDLPSEAQAPDKLLARWDAGLYGQIAAEGYSRPGPERAFFPLYPMLERFVAFGLGGDIYRAGVLISASAALLAGLFLYMLVRDFTDGRRALVAVASFFAFPTAFYLFAPYAEALFLAAAISALWLARRGRLLVSGVLIGIAGMARPTGWILLLPLAIEGVLHPTSDLRDMRHLARLGVALLMGAVGPIAALTLMHHGDNTSLWASYAQVNEQYWQVQFVGPWTTYSGAVAAAVFGYGLGPDWFTRAMTVVELLSGLFALGAVVVLVKKRAPASLVVLTLVTLALITSDYGPGGHPLDSMPRHVLSLFPIFAAVGMMLRSRRWSVAWFGTSTVLLSLSAAWFASGRWIS